MKVLGGLSTSVSVSVPVVVCVPGVAFTTPRTSITEPVPVPEMMAASLTPSILIVKVWVVESVPSDTVIAKLWVVGDVSALIAPLFGTKV